MTTPTQAPSIVRAEETFLVVHPLDDVPEVKRFAAKTTGQRRMTRAVRWSLMALRVYLLLILVLVLFRVARMVGAPR